MTVLPVRSELQHGCTTCDVDVLGVVVLQGGQVPGVTVFMLLVDHYHHLHVQTHMATNILTECLKGHVML